MSRTSLPRQAKERALDQVFFDENTTSDPIIANENEVEGSTSDVIITNENEDEDTTSDAVVTNDNEDEDAYEIQAAATSRHKRGGKPVRMPQLPTPPPEECEAISGVSFSAADTELLKHIGHPILRQLLSLKPIRGEIPCPACTRKYASKKGFINHVSMHESSPWAWAARRALANHESELNAMFSRARAMKGQADPRKTKSNTSGHVVSPQALLDAPLDEEEMVNPAAVYGSAARLQMLTMAVLVAQITIIVQLLRYICNAMRSRQPRLEPVPDPSDNSRQLVERYEELVSRRLNFRLRDQLLTGHVAIPSQSAPSGSRQSAQADGSTNTAASDSRPPAQPPLIGPLDINTTATPSSSTAGLSSRSNAPLTLGQMRARKAAEQRSAENTLEAHGESSTRGVGDGQSRPKKKRAVPS